MLGDSGNPVKVKILWRVVAQIKRYCAKLDDVLENVNKDRL
jgi:hypothetical protein